MAEWWRRGGGGQLATPPKGLCFLSGHPWHGTVLPLQTLGTSEAVGLTYSGENGGRARVEGVTEADSGIAGGGRHREPANLRRAGAGPAWRSGCG